MDRPCLLILVILGWRLVSAFVDSLLSTSKQYQWQEFLVSLSFVLTLKVSSHISKYKNYSREQVICLKKICQYTYIWKPSVTWTLVVRYCFKCVIQLKNDICRRMLSKDQMVFLVQDCTCLHCKDPCKHNWCHALYRVMQIWQCVLYILYIIKYLLVQQGEKKYMEQLLTFFLRNLLIALNFHKYLHKTSLNFLTLVGTIVYFKCCI